MPLSDSFKNDRPVQSLNENEDVKNFDAKKKGKPSIFIGSSTESLPTAQFIKDQFAPEIFEVDIWDEGIFGKNKTNIEWLKNFTDIYDFAIFIFVPEDEIKVQTRVDEKGEMLAGKGTRHNVVFEFGLFLGRIGSKKTYIVYDKEITDFINHFFTDLQYQRGDDEKHYISLYAYNGQYSQWVATKKQVPQYIAGSLQPQVKKIEANIIQSIKEVEIGFLPSTSLAIGYYKNFIRIVSQFFDALTLPVLPENIVQEMAKDEKLAQTVRLAASCSTHVVKIVIPDTLAGAEHLNFTPVLNAARLVQKSVPGISRPAPVSVFQDNIIQATHAFIAYDFPSTLNSSIDAIALINPHRQIRELLAEKERYNFLKAIKYLVAKDKKLSKYVQFITMKEFNEEVEQAKRAV